MLILAPVTNTQYGLWVCFLISQRYKKQFNWKHHTYYAKCNALIQKPSYEMSPLTAMYMLSTVDNQGVGQWQFILVFPSLYDRD